MQAVGRIGSYISRSVVTVSGPFHPFGGAVDVIVVEQPDGSYKSSPWYVRFGKFQGVLKSREKVVSISVNDVEAGFHMYLDNKGEAFFLKEVDIEDGCEVGSVFSPPSSSGEDSDKQPRNSCNYDNPNWSDSNANGRQGLSKTNSRRSQIMGLVFGRKSRKEEENSASDVGRTDSLERAEIAADLLDLKWSTNLDSPRCKKDNSSRFCNVDKPKDEKLKSDCYSYDDMGFISGFREPGSNNVEQNNVGVADDLLDLKWSTNLASPKCTKDNGSRFSDVDASKAEHLKADIGYSYDETGLISGFQETVEEKRVDMKYVVETSASVQSVGEDNTNLSIYVEEKAVYDEEDINKLGSSQTTEQEQLVFGTLDDFRSSGFADGVNESSDANSGPGSSLDQSIINDYMNDEDVQKNSLRTVPSDTCISKTDHVQSKQLTRVARSLPIMQTVGDKLEANNQTMAADVKILKESETGATIPSIGNPPIPVDSVRGSRRNWPFSFKRSRSIQVSNIDTNGCESPKTIENPYNSEFEGDKDVVKVKANKKLVKTLVPTSEQLASLNLKQGKNVVVFTFSTAMLGKQQVDARIFLWRWDDRVVISDVDGTITRSDLLGQFMPLVGMDWSQSGVAHLFSAIKENGYQLLFLSARSISQSFHTRQFLFNIKQDGKALPEGPVVISPDGLFPSLFREVVRRAPHEFKIACLEEIKALFPADTNPFYAGFGNRDTDELSYVKVGIPKGKIFIINPKGEIVVNRRVETKSYSSLHALVHGMFPSMTCSGQEDYNSWNFWKIPPPLIDL